MRRTALVLAFLLAGALARPAAAGGDLAPAALLEQRQPTVVSVKLLLRWGDREVPHTARGSVVDPSGLVLLSNDDFGGGEAKLAQAKVMFGTDPKEWDAVLVARDSVRNLAYLQVLKLEKPVPAVDLSQGAEPRLGQDLFGVWRDSRGFDFAPALRRLYVSGLVEKPRRMWSVAGDDLDAGLPVYDSAGLPVGVLVDQQSSEGAEEDAESRTMLLPLADVLRSLEAARKQVEAAVRRAEEGAEEKPAEPAAPAPDKPEAPAPEGPK